MKLIILHGAPASGKFTIAKELEKLTGYKLIHIHSIYDFLESVFDKERYPISLGILDRVSLDVFEQAAKAGLEGLIYTYAELARDEFTFMKEVVKRLSEQDVDIRLVHLSCDPKELHQRIANESRQQFAKTKDSKELDWLLANKDYAATFPDLDTLEIDTSKTSATESAKMIAANL